MNFFASIESRQRRPVPAYHLKQLDRNAYIASVATIQDAKTVGFATMSLAWWDKHYSWQAHGCVVLCDAQERHLCYIFYQIDRYRMYMTIHNIFTPLAQRRKGYAHELLKMVFDLAIAGDVKRFKLSSVSRSLDFYLALGFVYWGINSVGDYYCDLPIPPEGLDTLDAMVRSSGIPALIGKNLEKICTKVGGMASGLSPAQRLILDSDKIKMGESYMLEALQAIKKRSE
jgi:GNAT superfamily N-acetyltransferase